MRSRIISFGHFSQRRLVRFENRLSTPGKAPDQLMIRLSVEKPRFSSSKRDRGIDIVRTPEMGINHDEIRIA